MIFSVFQKNWVCGYSWSTLLWYRCYYPHRSRDAFSPVCGIFCSMDWFRFQKPLAIGPFQIPRYQDFWDKSLGGSLDFNLHALLHNSLFNSWAPLWQGPLLFMTMIYLTIHPSVKRTLETMNKQSKKAMPYIKHSLSNKPASQAARTPSPMQLHRQTKSNY